MLDAELMLAAHSWDYTGSVAHPAGERVRLADIAEMQELRRLSDRSEKRNYPLRLKRMEVQRGRKPPVKRFKMPDTLVPVDGPHIEGCRKFVINARVVEPLGMPVPEWLDGKPKLRAKFLVSQQTQTAYVRPLRRYDNEKTIVEILGVFPCGKCPLCALRKQSVASTNIRLEVQHAIAMGLPVTFWTFTLSSQKGHRGRIGNSVDGYSWEWFPRERMPGPAFKHMLYEWRRLMGRRLPCKPTIVTAVEPHKDGTVHGHAIVVGFDPVAKFGSTLEKNDCGRPVWLKPRGFDLWMHGRCEVVLLDDPQQAEKMAYYLGKYIAKGFDLDEAVMLYRQEIDGADFWQKPLLGWPRAPACGVEQVRALAEAHAEQLNAEGFGVFGDYPLDAHRRSVVQQVVKEKTGGMVPRSLDVSGQLAKAVINAGDSFEMLEEARMWVERSTMKLGDGSNEDG